LWLSETFSILVLLKSSAEKPVRIWIFLWFRRTILSFVLLMAAEVIAASLYPPESFSFPISFASKSPALLGT
jgi:hypothetical protein